MMVGSRGKRHATAAMERQSEYECFSPCPPRYDVDEKDERSDRSERPVDDDSLAWFEYDDESSLSKWSKPHMLGWNNLQDMRHDASSQRNFSQLR